MTWESWTPVEDIERYPAAKDCLHRWIQTRSLPVHKTGRLWTFKLSEIDDWVRAEGASEDPTGGIADAEF